MMIIGTLTHSTIILQFFTIQFYSQNIPYYINIINLLFSMIHAQSSNNSFDKKELEPILQFYRQSSNIFSSANQTAPDTNPNTFTNKMLKTIQYKKQIVQPRELQFYQHKINLKKSIHKPPNPMFSKQNIQQASTRPVTRNKSLNDIMSQIRTRTAKAQTIVYPNKNIKTSQTQIKSKIKKNNSKSIIKGITSYAKPERILTKEQRYNPYGKPIKIKQDTINKNGLYKLINMGIIPQNLNLKETLNHYIDIQRNIKQQKIKQNEQQNCFSPQAFLTNPQNLSTKNRRSTIKIDRTTQQDLLMFTEAPSPKHKVKIQQKHQILTILFNEIVQDQNFIIFRRKWKQQGKWGFWNEFLVKVKNFMVKYKINKFEFFPNINYSIRRITQQVILNSAKDKLALKGLIQLIKKGSPQFEQHRNIKLKQFLRMCIYKLRFKKTLSQICYINTIKQLYKFQKYQIQIKNKLLKTLNFKYEIFADTQRRIMEQQKYQNRRIVEIHINSFKQSQQKRNTYYKYKQRLNIQITRLFSFIKPKTEIIYVSPFQSINKDIQQYYYALINIHNKNVNQHQTKAHFFYPKKLECLSEKSNPDDAFYLSFNKNIKNQIKKITKGRMIRYVPTQISQIDIKITQILNASLLAGTLTKDSLQILFDDQHLQTVIKESDKQLMNKFEFRRYAILLNKQKNEHQKLKKQYQISKQSYFLKQKISKMNFSNNLYLTKIQVRQFFKKFNHRVPIALEDFSTHNFFFQFSKILMKNKDKTLWIFKMNFEHNSRGLAYLQTDSIKLLNQKKKKDFFTTDDLNELSKMLQVIIHEKLVVSHSSLYSRGDFIKQFLRVGGIVQACIKQCLTLAIFVQITPNGHINLIGSYKKICTNNFVTHLLIYPAKQLSQKQFQEVLNMSQQLYKNGIFGYISFQMLCYFDKTKKQYVYQYMELQCYLNTYSSSYFLYTHLLKNNFQHNKLITSELKQKVVSYCPFLDNNGFKCKDIKRFYALCKQNQISYDAEKKQGTIILLLGNDSSQVMSLMSIGSDQKKSIKYMGDSLNFICNMGNKNSQFDKQQHRKNEKIDNYYSLDTIWKVRQLNRILH